MNYLSKICDAADWFDEEFYRVVKDELREDVRFHRKQWEFAMIFLTLKKYDLLNDNKIGLSMGGGNERVLYSIAKYAKKLYVTDLYDESTSWDCARTENPQEFVLNSKPFPIDNNKLSVQRMDMRDLKFDDNTFDFCYSSCAVEHIGAFDDFVNHFNEVYRCLKEDGIYVFTTEFLFSSKTIKDENNYLFSPEYLNKLFETIELSLETTPDVALTEHEINDPLPPNVKNLLFNPGTNLLDKLERFSSHLTLIRGKYPFSSILFILRKKSGKKDFRKVNFGNYFRSAQYLDSKVKTYQDIIGSTNVSLNPFSSLPEGVSPFSLDHAEFFKNKLNGSSVSDTIFHTDYLWFGSHKRFFTIGMKKIIQPVKEHAIINIRIHRYSVLNSKNVECIFEKDIDLTGTNTIEELINIYADEDFVYAILAKMKSGNCKFKDITIRSTPAKEETKSKLNEYQLNNQN